MDTGMDTRCQSQDFSPYWTASTTILGDSPGLDPYIKHSDGTRSRLLEIQHEAIEDQALLDMMLICAISCDQSRSTVINKLISQFGGFADCVAASFEELRTVEGLGEAGVSALKIVQAAAIRLAKARVIDKPIIQNLQAVIEYMMVLLLREPTEQLRVLYLDVKNRLIFEHKLAHGIPNAVFFEPRYLVHHVLRLNATAVVLVHNHPSGDPTPSCRDIELTKKVAAVLAPLSVLLHDHIIIGNGRWVSLRQEAFI